jgi:hypothetical protein
VFPPAVRLTLPLTDGIETLLVPLAIAEPAVCAAHVSVPEPFVCRKYPLVPPVIVTLPTAPKFLYQQF